MISVVAIKIFLTCLVVFILCLIGDSLYSTSNKAVPNWIKAPGSLAFLLGLLSLVVFLIALIWE